MKFVLMLMLLITPLAISPSEEKLDKFLEEVDKGYSYYIVESMNTVDYDLTVVKGIYKNEPCYGVCYVGTDANKYHLTIENNGTMYSFATDDRGDSYGVAILANTVYEIHIFDDEGNEFNIQNPLLLTFSASDFDTTTATRGQNLSGAYSSLTVYKQSVPFFKVLIFASSIIIGSCGLIFLLLFLFRKGLFNKDKRRIGVVNVKEIYERETQNHAFEEDDFWPKNEETPTNTVNINEFEEEETSKIINVKQYLQEIGYVTTYNILSEEEKNKIMLELMHLKDTNKITLKDYYAETGELWKK